MFGARRHGIQIDACGACGGSWVPSDIARKMVASFVSFGVGADLAAIAERSSATRAVRTDQPRVCPDCALLLTRASVANVEIDVCASDGTWFDRHELCTILDRLLPDLESDAEVVPPEAFGVFGKRTWLPGERLLLASLLELASFGE